MSARRRLAAESGMASRWRRRQMCVLLADVASAASLRQVSAAGAFLETNLRPPIGQRVQLLHPDAGPIFADVESHDIEGITVRFDGLGHAAAFALTAIVADMSRVAFRNN